MLIYYGSQRVSPGTRVNKGKAFPDFGSIGRSQSLALHFTNIRRVTHMSVC